MSNVVLRYLKPISKKHGVPLNEDFLKMGIAVWNVATLKGAEREEAEEALFKNLRQDGVDQEQRSALKLLIFELLDVKRKRFNHVSNYITSYQMLPKAKQGDFQLTINSVVMD